MKTDCMNRLVVLVVCAVAGSAFASGFVHTTDTLSEARYYLSATTVGTKAIFAGRAAAVSSTSRLFARQTALAWAYLRSMR